MKALGPSEVRVTLELGDKKLAIRMDELMDSVEEHVSSTAKLFQMWYDEMKKEGQL